MKVFICTLLMFVAVAAVARTINVADHGIVPGKDASYALNRLIESLEGEAGVTLRFPKGRYVFFPENAYERYWAVTNHENALRAMAFPIFGLKGFTLDGGGSTFVFNGKMSPIVLSGTEGATLRNFSIDWDTPFHHELRVVESDPKSNTFVAEVYPEKYGFEVKGGELLFNHYDWQDEIGQSIAFDPQTKAPYWKTSRYLLKSGRGKAERVGPNRVRLQNVTNEAPPVGTIICAYGNGRSNRYAQAIHLSNAKDTVVEDVAVYAAGGMALIAERCENVRLNRMVVAASGDRIMSTRADATHFLGCKGLIKVENCLFERMADDGINVHGAYIKVVERWGQNAFLCEISHRQQIGLAFAEPGDRVMITSRETVLPLFETEVETVEVLNESRLIVTVSKMPRQLPDGLLSLENLTWYPDLELRRNIIRDNRARSALISTKGKVLVENNVFSSQMHGILIEGDNNSWYESGGVRDVTIRDNVFENIGYGSGEHYPLYISPLLRPEQRLGDEKYHRNIRFENNTLKSFNALLVHARSVKGLTLSGNVIERSDAYPSVITAPSIELDYCEDVAIEKNAFNGFDWPIRIQSADNTANVQLKDNKGL